METVSERYLRADRSTDGVMSHAWQLHRLEAVMRELLPQPLGDAARIGNCKSGQIVILARNGAVASKLGQMTTRLQAGFLAAGAECKGVTVKVQPGRGLIPEKAAARIKPISERAASNLVALGDSLPEGALKAALQRLVERSVSSDSELAGL